MCDGADSTSQEVIQNADDAKASTVKFFLDYRQHGTASVIDPALARFQGPALLVYNDATFSDDDWEGIQNLQRSIKADDPFKVGKFGIGFNSVYHITGMVMLNYSVTCICYSAFVLKDIISTMCKYHCAIKDT